MTKCYDIDHEVESLRAELEAVKKERDELVAAMRLIEFADYKPVARVARDALAKVGAYKTEK